MVRTSAESPTAVATRQTRGLSPARASEAAYPWPAAWKPMLVATIVGVRAVTRQLWQLIPGCAEAQQVHGRQVRPARPVVLIDQLAPGADPAAAGLGA